MLLPIIVATVLLTSQEPSQQPSPSSTNANRQAQGQTQPQARPTQPTQGTPPQPVSISLAPSLVTDNPNEKQPSNNSDTTADWWMVGLTGLTLVCTAVLVIVAGHQFRTQTKQTDEALRLSRLANDATQQGLILANRPRIAVRNMVVEALGLLHRKSSMKDISDAWNGGPISAYCHVVNIGRTVATIHAIHHRVLVGVNLPMKRPYDDGTPSAPTNVVLEPGESRKISLGDAVSIADDDLYEILGQRKTVFVLSLIQYRDSMGVSRQTAVCRRLDHETRRFKSVDDPDYEYSD